MNAAANTPSRARIVVAVSLLAFAGLYLYLSMGLSFGAWSNPRAGFVPRIAGIGGVALAAANLLIVVVQERKSADFGEKPLRAVLFVLGLIAYVPALQVVSFLPATAVLILYLVKVYGAKGWIVPVLVSGATAVGIFFLFSRLLQLPLP